MRSPAHRPNERHLPPPVVRRRPSHEGNSRIKRSSPAKRTLFLLVLGLPNDATGQVVHEFAAACGAVIADEVTVHSSFLGAIAVISPRDQASADKLLAHSKDGIRVERPRCYSMPELSSADTCTSSADSNGFSDSESYGSVDLLARESPLVSSDLVVKESPPVSQCTEPSSLQL